MLVLLFVWDNSGDKCVCEDGLVTVVTVVTVVYMVVMVTRHHHHHRHP